MYIRKCYLVFEANVNLDLVLKISINLHMVIVFSLKSIDETDGYYYNAPWEPLCVDGLYDEQLCNYLTMSPGIDDPILAYVGYNNLSAIF